MMSFLVRRGLQSLGVLFCVSLLGFLILHLAPGGPLSQYVAEGGMSPEDVLRLEKQMGLDRPFIAQYLDWLLRMLRGDWGNSLRSNEPVLTVIGASLGATLQLMAAAMTISILLGGWIGIVSGLRRYGTFDNVATTLSMIAVSVPTFFFGFIVIIVFSLNLGWIPSGDRFTVGDESLLDYLHHLIGPAVVLSLVSVATWSRYMRASVIDVLGQDFVRTARSKGLSARRILYRHVARNALLPMISLIGLHLPQLFGGALVTETIFTWPGIGRLFYDAIQYSDFPVVMGLLVFTAIAVLIGSLIADILYAVADPRIQL
ncbi:ABC transporter permease (plasmid) [Bosea sp. F3-2]|uniref:ABC transporter permease n=1 Tax=Bosea sp. F3-2 TaxID=2599640 RepID=UPI0011EDC6FF|nr:ABC transporter permease [Bosea sp. F3-2]QEL27351.1 ABC transporter permease [Bosea sp. F3-2]